MKVGYYQYRPLFSKVKKNLNKVIKALDGADADLLVLPELAFSGYYFQSKDELASLSEDVNDSIIIDELSKLCNKNNYYIVSGFTEKSGNECYNSSVLIGPQGLIHTYRKLHLFNEEKNYFTEGDTPLVVHDINGIKIGMMVCFDWAFPEVTRTLALMDVDIICHPSNLVLTFCQQTMLSRCLENRVFAITANRYGADKRPQGELKFTGNSQIVAPGGELLHRGPSQRDELYIIDIDPKLARQKNITKLNDLLTDRRPEYYKL